MGINERDLNATWGVKGLAFPKEKKHIGGGWPQRNHPPFLPNGAHDRQEGRWWSTHPGSLSVLRRKEVDSGPPKLWTGSVR